MAALTANVALIGRERELQALLDRLTAAATAAGGVVLIGGDPGIGKTRLVREFSEQAVARGMLVLGGRSYEASGMPPYLPFSEALTNYVAEQPPATLRARLGSGAADVALVVPGLRARLPDLQQPATRQPEEARFALFESVTAFLIALARAAGGLLLTLDDLHWADTPSLLLLEHLAARIAAEPLLVVGTYRSAEAEQQPALKQTLAALARERGSDRLSLGALAPEEVAGFVGAAIGAQAEPALVQALNHEAEGNPFFLGELLQLLAVDDGRLSAPTTWALAMPQTVGEVIERRLERLSESCRRTLSFAAVLGREFDLFPLRLATELDADTLLDALEEAELARVVTATGLRPGHFNFAHPLIRRTIYERIPASRRVRLHRRVGEALERLSESAPDAYITELANHFFLAAAGGDAARAVYYARRAGERSLTRLAYEEAANQYELALQALALEQQVDERELCELLLGLAEAQTRGGGMATARENFHRAAELADRLELPEILARCALGYAGYRSAYGRVDAIAVNLLERAAAAYAGRVDSMRARVLARLALELYYADTRARREELSDLAVNVARQTGDAATLASVLTSRHYALHDPENAHERLATATELVGLAERAGELELQAQAHYLRHFDALELLDVELADNELAEHARLSALLHQPLYAWRTDLLLALRATLDGRIDEAERLVLRAFAVAERAQIPNALQAFGIQMYLVRWEQDRLSEIEQQITAFSAANPAVLSWRSAVPLLYTEGGHPEAAVAAFESLKQEDFRAFPRDEAFVTTLAVLTLVADALGEDGPAALLYELLLPFEKGSVLFTGATACLGPVARFLGMLAGMLGRWESAEAHFESALVLLTRLRSRPLLARCRREYAVMLLRRDAPGDRERAARLLEQARAAAEQLGLTQQLRLLNAMRDGTFVDPLRQRTAASGAPALPAGLSEREAEVLALLASGATNREIAGSLYLSQHTVDHHIAHVYRKIGVRRRADATAFALQHGMIPGAR